jgi:tetratricopeptide (TPR) repeat protein
MSSLNGTTALDPDESRLWARASEEEDRLLRSGTIYQDKKLTAYVNSVAEKLSLRQKFPIRVFVIRNAYRNAWAYPNGAVFVTTGILARMENEAQLAALLGHEIVHVANRHTIQEFREAQNSSSFYSKIGAVFGYLLGIPVDVVGPIGAQAAVSGYSREKETEADMEGIERVKLAGYDFTEAPKLFNHLLEEMNDDGIEEPFFYGSHPHIRDRIDNYNDFIESHKAEADKKMVSEKKVFIENTRNLIYENIFIDIALGRMKPALFCADKYISQWPTDPRGYYASAETLRQLGSSGSSSITDTQKMTVLYNRAISCNSRFADAYKGLGMILFSNGDLKNAKSAFVKYQTLQPGALDREYISECIRQCK